MINRRELLESVAAALAAAGTHGAVIKAIEQTPPPLAIVVEYPHNPTDAELECLEGIKKLLGLPVLYAGGGTKIRAVQVGIGEESADAHRDCPATPGQSD